MTEFVLLAAGEGTRMRPHSALPKPLVDLDGRPLLAHVLDRVARCDPTRVVVVLGYRHEQVEAFLRDVDYEFPVITAVNETYERENGSSLHLAEPVVGHSFVVAMADHVVDPALYRRAAAHPGLGLCTDTSPPVEDPAEATKVQVEDGRVVAIGKDLERWDAVDTGVFKLTSTVFDALDAQGSTGEVTVTDAMTTLISWGNDLESLDVSEWFWADVDTPADLEAVERRLQTGPAE